MYKTFVTIPKAVPEKLCDEMIKESPSYSEQLAGVMSIVRRAKAMRDGKKFDEKADQQLKEMVIDYLEKLSHGLVASSMLTDDGIIDPRDTRDVIGFCLSIVNNNHIEGAKEYGVFRL